MLIASAALVLVARPVAEPSRRSVPVLPSLIDKGKTWTSLGSNVEYIGCNVIDLGTSIGKDAPHKVRIEFGDGPTQDISTPWPGITYGPLTVSSGPKGFGDEDGTLVRIKTSDGTKVILETSTDGGETYTDSLTVTTTPGYMSQPRLALQSY